MNTMNTMNNESAKAAALKFGLYTKNDLPEIIFKDQVVNQTVFNFSERINSAKIEIPDDCLSQFGPLLLFNVRKQENSFTGEIELHYIEHIYTAFETPGGNIAILRYDSRAKKYYLMPYYGYYRAFQDIDFYTRDKAQKERGPKEPNRIGTFTPKKISQWLEYCDAYIGFMDGEVNGAKDKNDTISEQVKDFVSKLGGKVSYWNTQTQVAVNGFRITFNHHKNTQYLETRIEFTGNVNDVLKLLGKL
jgi:hypothetical protein